MFDFLRLHGIPVTLPLLLAMVFAPFLVRQFVLYERAVYVARLTQSAIRRMMTDATRLSCTPISLSSCVTIAAN